MARGKTKQWSISLCETALCETALEDNPDQTRVGALDAEGSKQAGSRPSSPALGSEDSFLTAPTITDRGLFSTLQDEDTCALTGTATSRRGVPTLDGGSVSWASLSTPSASASSSLPNAHACPDAPFAADVPSTPVVSAVGYPRKLPEGDLSAGAGEAGLLSPGRGLEETTNKPLFGSPIPSSTCAMRRCRSAATLRQPQRHPSPRSSPREPAPWEGKGGEEGEGGRGGRQRRHRRVESILSFVAEESAEERDARMCRSRQRSNPCLVYQVRDWSGGPLGARKEGGKEGGKEEGEGMGGGGRGEDVGRKTGGREKDAGLPLGLVQDPLLSQEASPARLPPLTISRALSYGLQVAADRAGSWSLHKGETVGARGSAREGLKDDIFQARVQLELMYGGTLPSTSTFSHPPSLYYWEEAAPEVFQQVRAAFGVEEDAYRQSLMSILDGKEDLVPSPTTVAGPTTRKDQTGNVRNGKGSGKFTDTLEASESARAVSKPPAGPKGPAFPRMGWASPTPRREPFGQGGKSGSLFFKSQDEAFLLKTTSDAEHAFLLSLLHDYLQVILTRGPHSLLPRFLGLYTVKLPGRPACKLLCMKNIFHRAVPALRLLEKFDLKGSLIKRRVLPTLSPRVRRFSVLKDLNFCPRHDGTDDAGHPFRGASCSKGIGGEAGTEGGCRRLRLGVERKKQLLSYLAADVEWLRRRGIMDYSLLVGVGRISELATNHRWGGKDGGENPPPISVMEALRATAPDEASRQHLYNLWLPSIPPAAVSPPYASDVLRESGVSLTGQGTPRTTPPLSPSLGNGSRNAGPKSVNSFFSFLTSPSVATSAPTPILTKSSPSSSSIFRTQEVFLLGLVDILQTYTVKRRLETLIKGAAYTMEGHDPRNISVVEPDAFAERFLDFIDRHTI
ncbi:phosphatidylinositol-4-phosphate 5-kinase its3 [Nannochloropsis gaditana]|uniref:Phosphatidylinositol-4-phosphate 5-kinase its3 n=1 Tax=Nannochloropsis gaditana TaxID=72520 RepID=W7TJS2_9STRA|nr:phosphatidylinositol-4-phosphate 5-kinase its3 [Nannochloropsis gaditana]